MMRIFCYTILFSSVIFLQNAGAQENRMTEGEIKKQQQYISAFTKTLYDTGDAEKATEELLKVLKDDPLNDAANYSLAKIYFQSGELEKALNYAQRAYNIDAENKWYAIMVAQVYESLEQYAEAAQIYENLHELYPHNQTFAINHAFSLFSAGERVRALDVLEQAEMDRGFNTDLSLKKIQVLEALDKDEAIVTEWEKLIAHDPENMNWQLNLAQHYLRNEDYTMVENTLNDILLIDPENVRAQLALTQLRDDSSNQTTSELKTLIDDPLKSIDLKINALLPEVIHLSPDSTEKNHFLLSLAENLTVQYPQNAKAWSLLGDFNFNMGNTGAATQAFAKACNLTKSVYTVWEQYLRGLNYTGQFKLLSEKADEALMYFPNKAENYYLLACANVAQENYQAALVALQQGQMMAGKNYGLLQEIAGMQAYIATVKEVESDAIERAITSFNTAEEVSPEAVLWLLYAGKNHNRKPGKNLLELIRSKTIELTPTMDIHYVKAVYYQQMGNMEEALKQGLESYYLTGYTRPATAILIGDIYAEIGHKENAHQWYESAANQGYSKEIIKSKINSL